MTAAQAIAWDPSAFVGYSAKQLECIRVGFEFALGLAHDVEKAAIWKPKVPELAHDELMLKRYNEKISPQGRLERRIAAALIDHVVAAGFPLVGASDGEDWLESANPLDVLSFVFERDSNTTIRFAQRSGNEGVAYHECGVVLVLGNGVDLISDYHIGRFGEVIDKFDPEEYA